MSAPTPLPRRHPATPPAAFDMQRNTTAMRALIAPDKFKGSLTAAAVADRLGRRHARGRRGHHHPAARRRRRRQRRGGGGGRIRPAPGHRRRRHWATRTAARIAVDADTAVVEVANTCGLTTLPAGRTGGPGRRQPRPRTRRRPRAHHPAPPAGHRPGRQRQHRRRDGAARRARLHLPRPHRTTRCRPAGAPWPGSRASTPPPPGPWPGSRSSSPATSPTRSPGPPAPPRSTARRRAPTPPRCARWMRA